jgi:lipopolysaccharide transport system permease protein
MSDENLLMNAGSSDRARPSEIAPPAAVAVNPALEIAHHDQLRVFVESEEDGVQLHLSEVWRYRELLYFLTWRDVKVRYKQTLMGGIWVVVQPLFSMILFTLFFNKFAGIKSGTMPYPLFAYSGLILWLFFANAVTNSTNSLISNTNLITKVYFPRMFIPAAAVGAGLVDLAVASVILFGLAIYYGADLGWSLWLMPMFIALTVLLALAVGLLISALTVKYRDLRHALPFLMQLWMFASPVIYPGAIVPARWRWILIANPFAPVVEGFRACLSPGGVDWRATGVATASIVTLLAISVYVFRRMEDTFADLI